MSKKGSKQHKWLIQLNLQKTNNPVKNMGRRNEQTFFQRRYAGGQQIYEKMLNIVSHQGNANENHNED